MKKTIEEWIKDRPRTPEEWDDFKEARARAKLDAMLANIRGKTVTGTFCYDHSKNGDIDIIFDDGSRLHIIGQSVQFHANPVQEKKE